jgi:hypothetical protein
MKTKKWSLCPYLKVLPPKKDMNNFFISKPIERIHITLTSKIQFFLFNYSPYIYIIEIK